MSWGNSMLSRYPVPITVKLSGELFLTGTDSRLILSLGHASSRSISLYRPCARVVFLEIRSRRQSMEITLEKKESRNEGNVVVGSGVGRCCTSATRGAPRARRQREHRWWPPTRSTGVVVVCRFPKSRLQQRQGHVERARFRHAPCRPSSLATAPRAPASHTLSTRSSYFSSRFSYLARFLSSWTGDAGPDLICRVSCVVSRMQLRELWMRRVVSTLWVEVIASRISKFWEGWTLLIGKNSL